ncbi:heme peroxidase [Crepidotus variabilis]|uniref:Peroxidase n=1 Tax=Crepidotus variabilis TaxID=179855 RepID=A0A9P6JRY9_9AGAR|nr:heme peroxidase [Crepidotus variabilis]
MARLSPLLCTLLLVTIASVLGFTVPTKINYTWPNPQYDALEKLLYEGTRLDGLSLSDSVSGCKSRDGQEGRGTGNVAAEWVRFAFHDAITHNIDDGTGGIDGSLFHELDRDENRGQGMKDTSADFLKFAGRFVSRADIVAMGAIFGMSSCGGQNILPYGGGRVDAQKAGRCGVPVVEQSVDQFTEAFRHLGLNSSQAIALTVCGHALGGVRSVDFPNIVPPSSDPHQVIYRNFDTTPQFDSRVVTEYLDGTTQNPLVVNANQTVTSDKRLFESDGGAAMRVFQNAGDRGFKIACREAYRVMINTIPAGVSLHQIDILPAKVIEPQITIENGELIFKVDLRLTQNLTQPVPLDRTITLKWCDKRGSQSDCNGRVNTAQFAARSQPTQTPVTDQLGLSFYSYAFRVAIDIQTSVGKFWFVVDNNDGNSPTTYNNGGANYDFQQDSIIFLPRMSQTKNAGKTLHKMVVGVRIPLVSTRVYMKTYEVAKSNTEQPQEKSTTLSLDGTIPPQKGYAFFSGDVSANLLGLTIDIGVDTLDQSYKEEYLNARVLGCQAGIIAPTTVSTA